MTTFHLVRHGEKAGGTSWTSGRTPGIHLSENGRAQAERVAELLARQPVHRIFSSPLERARETAAPLARHFRMNVEIADALIETDLGEWTQADPFEVAGQREFERYNRCRSLTRIPAGETMLEVQARVVGAMLRWRDEMPAQTLVLVSHAEPIRAALLYFSGLPLDLWSRYEIELASVATIELGADNVRVCAFNQTADIAA